ncbi:hypothetical protein L1049_024685 [Liquidambar formosana]|uniref:EF-hand domain-containing protein n=1 Tax=Liquidambar formosana TaxID=63359 RepID=A0AAP0X1G3_LIQFO
MAADRVSRPSTWASNKDLKLSFNRLRSKSISKLSPSSSPISSPLTPRGGKRQEQLKEVFKYFDGDGDGKISALELRNYFASIGEYMSHEQAQGVINDFDTDGDDLLDFKDFVKLMKREGGDEDLKMAFEMFELEKGSGCITPKSLQRTLSRLGDSKSLDECEVMIKVFDVDRNGVLDFQEFHQMMMA